MFKTSLVSLDCEQPPFPSIERTSVGRAVKGAKKRFISRPVLRAPYASALAEGKGRLLVVHGFEDSTSKGP